MSGTYEEEMDRLEKILASVGACQLVEGQYHPVDPASGERHGANVWASYVAMLREGELCALEIRLVANLCYRVALAASCTTRNTVLVAKIEGSDKQAELGFKGTHVPEKSEPKKGQTKHGKKAK